MVLTLSQDPTPRHSSVWKLNLATSVRCVCVCVSLNAHLCPVDLLSHEELVEKHPGMRVFVAQVPVENSVSGAQSSEATTERTNDLREPGSESDVLPSLGEIHAGPDD